MHYLFSPRPRDLPEESHKDETRREDEASVSHYCCNLHCSVFCKLVHYIDSRLSIRSISIEWLTVIIIILEDCCVMFTLFGNCVFSVLLWFALRYVLVFAVAFYWYSKCVLFWTLTHFCKILWMLKHIYSGMENSSDKFGLQCMVRWKIERQNCWMVHENPYFII